MKPLVNLALSLATLLPASAALADACSALVGSCDYYACVDAQRVSCGSEGYALGYGKVYCEKFTAIDFAEIGGPISHQVWQDVGNEWRDGVRSCLQEEMEAWFAEDGVKDCASLRAFAFGSHPRCYTKGPSFCELPPEDLIAIGTTIDPATLLAPEGVRQVRDTAKICTEHAKARWAAAPEGPTKAFLAGTIAVWGLLSIDPQQLMTAPHN